MGWKNIDESVIGSPARAGEQISSVRRHVEGSRRTLRPLGCGPHLETASRHRHALASLPGMAEGSNLLVLTGQHKVGRPKGNNS